MTPSAPPQEAGGQPALESALDEDSLIRRFFVRAPRPGCNVILGIGDDGAVVRPRPGEDWVIATDSLAQGTHFPEGLPPHALGYRCLAVNLSDLAAMGARPAWATLALSLPRADSQWLAGFSQGFFQLADEYELSLIGGDTIRGPLGMTVTVLGHISPGRHVTRTGARPGDQIFVTGYPGDAVSGRLALAAPAEARTPDVQGFIDRFLYPAPRVREGQLLAEVASAMIDVSDGLHVDLTKLLNLSGVGGELHIEQVPLSAPLRKIPSALALERALTGGDDYELCFTVPQEHSARLNELARGFTCPLTALGQVVAEPGARWRQGSELYRVPTTSYRHF